MKKTKSEKTADFIITVFMILVAFICLYPLIYVFSASVSNVDDVLSGNVTLLPKHPTLLAYKKVLENPYIGRGYINAMYITVFGTVVQLLFTTLGAYPLSKKRLMGRSQISMFVAITMWFNGGLVPMYLTFVDYNLVNSLFGIIIGFACTASNVIILRTFFQSIPKELEEAAKVDGAGQWRILFQIYMPISKAAYATLGLLYAIGRWNGYVWALILLKDENLHPLQVILKKLIVDTTFSAGDGSGNYNAQMVVYAVIVVSVVPVLIIYPFVQKYFKKGMMLGSVKG